MQKQLLAILFACLAITGPGMSRAADVVVVRATASAADESERNYADSVTRRLARWLTAMNLPHRIVNDESVSAGDLANAGTVVLGCNPVLPARELSALKAFCSEGGKLVVFYSSDAGLAKLMNMRLGEYLAEKTKGRWSVISFTRDAPPYFPGTVAQQSRNIRPVYPISGKSRTIAMWQNSAGNTSAEPAIVQSDTGFWMSHVLLDDGDTENKQLLLLAMIGHGDRSAWLSAASHSLAQSSVLPGHAGFEDTLDATPKLQGDMKRLFDEKKYPEVVAKGRELASYLTESYAIVQRPSADKFRGLWEQTGMGLFPGDWDRTCKFVAEQGFTDILPNMLKGGIAHYDSKVLAPSETFQLFGDQLGQCTKAAHKNGLRVHVWKMCWRLDGAPEDTVRRFKKQDRLQVTDSGRTTSWLCPSNVENLQLEKDSVREILQNYEVDGIHLDLIRYMDSHTCYCAGCKARFQDNLGRKISKWPIPAGDSGLRKDFNIWRRSNITRLVRDISAIARKLKPGVRISASVYPNYASCADSIAQDWPAWLRDNLVDFVCPMDYFESTAQFSETIDRQLALPSAQERIYPGIGATAAESRLSPVQVIDQIAILRKKGASGFAIFDLNKSLSSEILPLLRLRITAQR